MDINAHHRASKTRVEKNIDIVADTKLSER